MHDKPKKTLKGERRKKTDWEPQDPRKDTDVESLVFLLPHKPQTEGWRS